MVLVFSIATTVVAGMIIVAIGVNVILRNLER
jgi:hypothetical protein